MSATFTTIISGIRTTTVGEFTDVIKRVSWTLSGTQDGQTFELPQETELGPVDPENFTPLSEFTTSTQVVTWVEAATENLEAIKAHIQTVLDRECAKTALTETAMPWVPAP